MRVKRLEIQGFKSFKDKTVIHFDEGITGIVGPNGCGKSNIVDAFFWVMGEQSFKHMRGTGSEDLIFNGSSKYQPLGMAEATMVLETDAQDIGDPESGSHHVPTGSRDIPIHLRAKEIAVTRRVYRDGIGEYFINGVQARLKDIQELFMDTGVGAKGYSVIEQGQIGKIVNAKPEERRLLIEEAAGIAKYKARKKESLRKMESAQGNLARLNDVIQEIERNLNSLERQAQKARLHKKYHEELTDKEMTWGRRKNLLLKEKLDGLRAQRDAIEQELAGLRAELQTTENGIEVARAAQLGDTKAAEELQHVVQELSQNLTREQSALDLSRKRQGDLTTQLESLRREREELGVTIGTEQERIARHEADSAVANEELEAASQRARSTDEQVRGLRTHADEARRLLETTRRDLMTGITQASDLNSRAASLSGRLESARIQAEKLVQQAESLGEKVASVSAELEKARGSCEQIRVTREGLKLERKEQVVSIQAQDLKLKQGERDRDQSVRSLAQLKSRLQSLEELAAAYEGFGDGPKAALDWAKAQGLTGLGVLADLLNVSPGYEAALEGWLENRLESLITSDPAMAVEVLKSLREGKHGRAAIQVAAPGRTASASAADLANFHPLLEAAGFEVLGALAGFVSVGSEMGTEAQSAARSLLANVVLVRSAESVPQFLAQNGLKKLSDLGWSLVSLDGVALDASGILRGGSTESDSTASVLGRKKAIAELQTLVVGAEQSHSQLEALLSESKSTLELARARLHSLETEIQGLEVQGAALERDVHQMDRSFQDTRNQLSLTDEERAETQSDIDSILAEQATIQDQIYTIISSRADLESQISERETAVTTQEEALRVRDADLQHLRIQEASLRERASSLKREMDSGRQMLSDRQRRLADIERILDRASREHDEHSGGDSGLELRITDLTRSISENRDRLSEVKNRLEISNGQLNSAIERVRELHKLGDQKNSDSMQAALDAEKASGELNYLIQNLDEKYGPGCLDRPASTPIQEEMSEPVITREMSAEEELALGEEVERLRERIRRLGEVNVMAIEEYEILKKRFDYLLSEKGDLELSIRNLQEAIEYINKTSEERFRKAFEAIAERFERLFPIIFGGGQACLSLVYSEGSTDILEAGVDILAQPPGKKIVNMQALSGGEKALTAVSLIFAIFMVKPSPFCVLDEVDAPLDDANVGKFNALLKEMSAKSQFILITHNKKTMELNDTLYGVTMEEPGVSKMVSVELH